MTMLEMLQAPMGDEHVQWRVQRSGSRDGKPWAQVVPYASVRFLQERLDEACGPFGWSTKAQIVDTGHVVPEGLIAYDKPVWIMPSVIMSLGIDPGDGNWVWKTDGSEFSDFSPTKGGFTHAFRRACVPWNVGSIRSLYEVEGPMWANIHSGGSHRDKIDGQWLEWDPPLLFGPNGLLAQAHTTRRAPPPAGEGHAPPRQSAPSAPSQSSNGKTDSHGQAIWAQTLTRGKHKGLTWHEVSETAPDYIRWALENTNWVSDEDKELMLESLAASEEQHWPEAVEDDLPFD